MMDKVRVALIGCGRVGNVHAQVLNSLDETELVACVDIKPERAEEYCKKYGGQPYTNFEEVLQRADIDVVEIATPHHAHAHIAIAAAKAGKHILTEKPMAIKVAHIEEMIKAADENGITLGVILQNRYNDSSQAVKKAIETGELGEIKAARAFVTWNRDDAYYAGSDWKGRWETEGGGALINQAIHTIDLMQWLIGDQIDNVRAHYDTWGHEAIEVEDVAMGLITFKSGVKGHVYANTIYPSDPPNFLEIYGTKGTARIISDHAVIKVGDKEYTVEANEHDIDDGSKEYVESTGVGYWGFSHKRQIREYYQDILAGRKHRIDGEVGKYAALLVLAMYESSRKQEPVYFPYCSEKEV